VRVETTEVLFKSDVTKASEMWGGILKKEELGTWDLEGFATVEFVVVQVVLVGVSAFASSTKQICFRSQRAILEDM